METLESEVSQADIRVPAVSGNEDRKMAYVREATRRAMTEIIRRCRTYKPIHATSIVDGSTFVIEMPEIYLSDKELQE
ncbi:hypothetical protein KY359_03640 [Candidatus Woesearchaeota archaeon]|nr:hypothetical protein [Candidatus Woesearchaeota archaeon]